jgi:hypothetical protein
MTARACGVGMQPDDDINFAGIATLRAVVFSHHSRELGAQVVQVWRVGCVRAGHRSRRYVEGSGSRPRCEALVTVRRLQQPHTYVVFQ